MTTRKNSERLHMGKLCWLFLFVVFNFQVITVLVLRAWREKNVASRGKPCCCLSLLWRLKFFFFLLCCPGVEGKHYCHDRKKRTTPWSKSVLVFVTNLCCLAIGVFLYSTSSIIIKRTNYCHEQKNRLDKGKSCCSLSQFVVFRVFFLRSGTQMKKKNTNLCIT